MIRVLAINVGSEPIKTEKLTFPLTERELAKQTVLTVLNKMGKQAEAIVNVGDKWWLYSHTAARGPSSELHVDKLSYHPLMGELSDEPTQ